MDIYPSLTFSLLCDINKLETKVEPSQKRLGQIRAQNTMKNYTLCALVALVFALCAEHTSAQMTYAPAQWWGQTEVARHGPYWLFKPMAYDFSTPVIRQVYVSTSQPWPTWVPYQYPALSAYPDYIPASQQANAGLFAETTLVGQGIDSLFLGPLSTSFNMGWSAMVMILDQNYEVLQTVSLFQNTVPSSPPVLTVSDPVIGQATLITFNINVQQAYLIGGGASAFTQKVKARLFKAGGGYDVTLEWTLPTGPGPLVANFSLPFNGWQGEYCLDVWYEVYHNPSTPKYWNGTLVVWEYLPPCFYHGITTGVDEIESTVLSVFPNPFTDQLVVTAPNAGDYQLFTASGQLVQTGRLMPGENRLSFPGLTPGAYILHTEDGQTVRLVKE